MQTALDAPPGYLDAPETNFVDKIRQHGWFATHVSGEAEHPAFAYSTGFWLTLGVPEIVIFSLKQKTAQETLWSIFRDLKDGVEFPTGVSLSRIFIGADAFLFPVAKNNYPAYLGWSRWFYGNDDFPCHQLVWSDQANVFPWQAGFDEVLRRAQPNLSEAGATGFLPD